MILIFDCKKSTKKINSRTPKSGLQDSFYLVENIKRDYNIKRIKDVAYPVILTIMNDFSYDVSFNFKVTALLKEYNGNTHDLRFKQNVSVPRNQNVEIVMFDNSGFLESRLQLDSVDFQNNKQSTKQNYSSNSPFLINMDEITNPYNGFQSKDELEGYFLFLDYVNYRGSLYARGMLLQFLFDDLKKIKPDTVLQIDGNEINLTKNNVYYLRSAMQTDIISKIMIYVEDLIIFSVSMLEPDKNYYRLLDKKSPDVGNRVTEFFDDLDELSDGDARTILSHDYPNNSDFDPDEIKLVNEIIQENIQQFKQNLKLISEFRDGHIQMFRRYKHAGWPSVFGVQLQQPSSSKTFDSYTIIPVDSDPLNDVVLLPYSNDVIQRYKKMIIILRQTITPVVKNRIGSINRQTTGIIPDIPTHRSNVEKAIFNVLVKKFHQNNPIRCRDRGFHFASEVNEKTIKWYLNSDSSV